MGKSGSVVPLIDTVLAVIPDEEAILRDDLQRVKAKALSQEIDRWRECEAVLTRFRFVARPDRDTVASLWFRTMLRLFKG